MLKRLRPCAQMKRLDDISLSYLQEHGIRGLLIDVDNTLTEDNRLEVDSWAQQYLHKIQAAGIGVCLLSNNNSERVRPLIEQLGCRALPKAGKPSKTAYDKALSLLGLSRKEAAAVGDQLFTDILGANRAGIWSILVEPISKKEIMVVRIKRPLERLVCKWNHIEMSKTK